MIAKIIDIDFCWDNIKNERINKPSAVCIAYYRHNKRVGTADFDFCEDGTFYKDLGVPSNKNGYIASNSFDEIALSPNGIRLTKKVLSEVNRKYGDDFKNVYFVKGFFDTSGFIKTEIEKHEI